MVTIIALILFGLAFLCVILAVRFGQIGSDTVGLFVVSAIVGVIGGVLLLWIPRYVITNQARNTERDYDRAVLLYCPPVRGAETLFEQNYWNALMDYKLEKFNGAIYLYHANKTGIWFGWQTTDVRDDIKPLNLKTLCLTKVTR